MFMCQIATSKITEVL